MQLNIFFVFILKYVYKKADQDWDAIMNIEKSQKNLFDSTIIEDSSPKENLFESTIEDYGKQAKGS